MTKDKIVFVESLLLLIIWLVILNLESGEGFMVLDNEAKKELGQLAFVQKILWAIMICLQIMLCYSLYKLIRTKTGSSKFWWQLYLGFMVVVVLFSLVCLYVGLTSMWLF